MLTMRQLLLAQQAGADFPTLLHLLAQRLKLNGQEWAKVTDTANEYVSYCSNPCLLERHRDPLDWTMLLFFVLNNSTSTYADGTKHVPVLTKIEAILANGIAEDMDALEKYDLFLSLTALLRQSIVLQKKESALVPMVKAFQGFHLRMAAEFLSDKRPDTTLEDYVRLRRTTIATFWWRDILVCFLDKQVDFDEATSDAIADAVWLGNDIRSLHRDESNVLDFIDEDDLLGRLAKAYDDLDHAFSYIPSLHREVICLIVVGTSAIYPAMEKYGGSRYACDSDLARRARSIQILCGKSLVSKAPALMRMPLIADALNEWCKPLDATTRVMQRSFCFQTGTCSLSFAKHAQLDVFSSVCRIRLDSGEVVGASDQDRCIAASKVVWLVSRSPALAEYTSTCECIKARLRVSLSTIMPPSNNQHLSFRLLLALATVFPQDHTLALAVAVDQHAESNLEASALCDALTFLLENKAFLTMQSIRSAIATLNQTLEDYGRDCRESNRRTRESLLRFWSLAGCIGRLVCLIGVEAFDGVLSNLLASLKDAVVQMRGVDDERFGHGYVHAVVDRAFAKLAAGVETTRELVYLNGITSTSRVVCEPIGELVFAAEPEPVNSSTPSEGPICGFYALSANVLTSLMAKALIDAVCSTPSSASHGILLENDQVAASRKILVAREAF
jgi:hypothetical protein